MYNKILAHTVSYNGLDFVNSPLLHIPGGFLCLKEFSFFEVPTSISTEKYAMRHGEYVSPTEKKKRNQASCLLSSSTKFFSSSF